METSSADPPKTWIYSRSAAFRWGVWTVALAVVLIIWSSLGDPLNREKLQTAEGTLVDYGPGPVPSSTQRPLNLLRLQKPDGTLVMFGSWEPLRAPKAGWQKGQPIRVKHDVRDKLHQVVIADEVILDIPQTQPKENGQSKIARLLGILLFLIGLPLTVVGYVSSKKPQKK